MAEMASLEIAAGGKAAEAATWLRAAAAAAEAEGEAAQAQLVMSGCAGYLVITPLAAGAALEERVRSATYHATPPLSIAPATWWSASAAALRLQPYVARLQPYVSRCTRYQNLLLTPVHTRRFCSLLTPVPAAPSPAAYPLSSLVMCHLDAIPRCLPPPGARTTNYSRS